MVPPPVSVRVVPFLATLPVRSSVPPPALMLELAAVVIGPAKVLVPVLARVPPFRMRLSVVA